MRKREDQVQKAIDGEPIIEDGETSSTHDMFEARQMKKFNQKFSKLMSFDIDKTFNRTQVLLNKNQRLHQAANNMTALDNMRLNQNRFKTEGPNSVMKFADLIATNHGFTTKQRRTPVKTSQKPLRVRFSLDKDDED